MFRLSASQFSEFTVSGEDRRGNAAVLEDIKVTSSDETIVTVADLGNGKFSVEAVGKAGTAQVNITADTKVGAEVSELTGSEMVEVVAGEAVALKAQFGEPQEQP